MNTRAWTLVSCLLLLSLALLAAPRPAAAVGVGETCGGIAAIKCDAGLACKYPVNQCNVADLAGKCVKVPDTCPKKGPKVCGCDDKTYDNGCELLKAGAREAHKGACKKGKAGYTQPSTPR
jgi:hypothetical protein